jgi:hypothetical protein
MNAQQRRKAYRNLPKAGTVLELHRPARIVLVRVLGYSAPVLELASTVADYWYAGTRPSMHRVRVETIPGPFETAARSTPLVSRLRAVPSNMRHLILAA